MQFDWRVRLGLVIGGAVIVAVAIAGASWGALDSELVDDALKMVGALLAGLGIASGKGRGVAALILAASMGVASCGGSQGVDVERCSATVLRCAVQVAADCIPRDDGEACPLEATE